MRCRANRRVRQGGAGNTDQECRPRAWRVGRWFKLVEGDCLAGGQGPPRYRNPESAASRRTSRLQNGLSMPRMAPLFSSAIPMVGAIITGKAGNNPKVVGLVYVAAFGPDTGETLGTTAKGFPSMPAAAEIRPTEDKFLVLTPKGVREDFAQDLSAVEKATLLATQGPTAFSVFGAPISNAAWHDKPSWFVVAANDRTINPDYERFAAKRMGAKVLEIPTSHVAMLAKPKEVADFIVSAAELVHSKPMSAVAR